MRMLAALAMVVIGVTAQAGPVTYTCKDANGNWTNAACNEQHSSSATTTLPRGEYCQSTTPLPSGLADRCLNQYRSVLLDSRGAYVVNGIWAKRGDRYRVVVEGRARNKLGGFIPVHVSCAASADGSIDSAETAEIITLWQAFQTLEMRDSSGTHVAGECND